MADDRPVWRSLLFVPVNVRKFVDTAHTRGADAIILDLEDSVPPTEKAAARDLVPAAAAQVSRGGADVVVRINRPWRMAVRDIEASVGKGVTALSLPKIADACHVRAIAEVVDEVEREKGLEPGHTRLIAMVETTDAFFRMHEIAGAHPRLIAMTLGGEDFALSAEMQPDAEALFYPSQQMIFAARAAGLQPLGFVGSIAEYRDQEKFRNTIRQARRLGFFGAACIHPLQVEACNDEFAPHGAEVERARAMVAAYDQAQAEARGSVEFDGQMIDEPVVDRARRLIALADRLAARQKVAAAET